MNFKKFSTYNGEVTWTCGVCGSINILGEACPICSKKPEIGGKK